MGIGETPWADVDVQVLFEIADLLLGRAGLERLGDATLTPGADTISLTKATIAGTQYDGYFGRDALTLDWSESKKGRIRQLRGINPLPVGPVHSGTFALSFSTALEPRR